MYIPLHVCVYMYIIKFYLSIYSLINTDCPYTLSIVNTTIINTGVQISLQNTNYSNYIFWIYR